MSASTSAATSSGARRLWEGPERCRSPTGASFGFTVQGPDGGKLPNPTGIQFHDDGSREVAPIPPGNWSLVYWIDGEKVFSPETIEVRRGAVTEVLWKPGLFDR